VLQTTHQAVVVRPYHANLGKRLVKTPKVYFADTGTLCHLAGLRHLSAAASGPLAGAIFETAVFMEIRKTLQNRGEDPQIHFWRTSAGSEVDFLMESQGRLVPIEAKASATARPGMGDGIRALRRDLGSRVAPGYVVYAGDVRLPLGDGITALPMAQL
jgi:hypothetical protein